MKTGIIGGSFNPVHYGHLELSEKVLSHTDLDEIWLMPCYDHPFHKENAQFSHRYEMIEIALEEIGNDRVKVSDFERRNNRKSTTVDTLKKLYKEYPSYKFNWIIGSDNLCELDKWKNYQELLEIANFIIVKRPGYEPKFVPQNSTYLEGEFRAKISSTEIRNKIKEGKSVEGLLPRGVIEYIEKNGLYR